MGTQEAAQVVMLKQALQKADRRVDDLERALHRIAHYTFLEGQHISAVTRLKEIAFAALRD
jgi:protein-disulfide isomerase-like protein with CxxC motif